MAVHEFNCNVSTVLGTSCGGWVQIEGGTGAIRVHGPRGVATFEGAFEPPGWSDGVIWEDWARSPVMLLVFGFAPSILVLDLKLSSVREIDLGRDYDHVICPRDVFVESRLGPLFCYERGVIALSFDGSVRWSDLSIDPADFVDWVSEDRVSYMGVEGDVWAYDLNTGERLGDSETSGPRAPDSCP